jgi:hypothetical protein
MKKFCWIFSFLDEVSAAAAAAAAEIRGCFSFEEKSPNRFDVKRLSPLHEISSADKYLNQECS